MAFVRKHVVKITWHL